MTPKSFHTLIARLKAVVEQAGVIVQASYKFDTSSLSVTK
jgi:hypothetical protein